MSDASASTTPVVSAASSGRATRMTNGRLALIGLLLVLSSATLGLGLVGPCMTIQPAFDEFDGWVRVLRPELAEPSTYSILSGIHAMRSSGSGGIAALLFGFSVVFPVLKLAAMAWGAAALRLGTKPGAAVKVVNHLGKFSMLDVMVIGLFILAAKGLPGGSTITLGWGVWAFAASVLLSLVGSILLHRAKPMRV